MKCHICGNQRVVLTRQTLRYIICHTCDLTMHWSPAAMTPDNRRGYIPLAICTCKGCEELR